MIQADTMLSELNSMKNNWEDSWQSNVEDTKQTMQGKV